MTLRQIIVSLTLLLSSVCDGQADHRGETSIHKNRDENVKATSAGIYSQQKFTRGQKRDLKSLQGEWINDKDSFATLTVSGQSWTFNYWNQQPSTISEYEIVLKDSIFTADKTKRRMVLLLNSSDSLEYEVLGLNDSLLSLMQLPTGRLHLYKKGTKAVK
jgi:hypothetical protein